MKAERNQLEASPEEPEITWKELLQKIQDNERDKQALANWQPRNSIIGKTVPNYGEPSDYQENTPERKLAEFLNFWKSNNYGYMAKCIYSRIGDSISSYPKYVREEYYEKRLKSWQFSEVFDSSPAVTLITIKVIYEENDLTQTKHLQARMILHDDKDIVFFRGKPGSRWALVSWHLNEVK